MSPTGNDRWGMRQCPMCGRAIQVRDGRFVKHGITRKPGAPTCPKSERKA